MAIDDRGIIDRFKKLMMLNEIESPGDQYKLTHARGGTSGYSFGLLQYDISNNLAAKNMFDSIMELRHFKTYAVGTIKDIKETVRTNKALTKSQQIICDDLFQVVEVIFAELFFADFWVGAMKR